MGNLPNSFPSQFVRGVLKRAHPLVPVKDFHFLQIRIYTCCGWRLELHSWEWWLLLDFVEISTVEWQLFFWWCLILPADDGKAPTNPNVIPTRLQPLQKVVLVAVYVGVKITFCESLPCIVLQNLRKCCHDASRKVAAVDIEKPKRYLTKFQDGSRGW